MDEHQITEWIDRYDLGELDQDEKKRFEDLYQNDPAFRRQVDQHREIQEVLGDRQLLELSRGVRDIFTKDKAAVEKESRNLLVPALLIVVALLVLMCTAYWLTRKTNIPADNSSSNQVNQQQQEDATSDSFNTNTNSSPSEISQPTKKNYLALAAPYYKSPDFPYAENIRGEESSPAGLMRRAGKAYLDALDLQKTNPSEGRKLFETVVLALADPPEAIAFQAHYLRGHAKYQLGKFNAAATDFDFVAGHENLNSEDAKWFQALSLLSVNERRTTAKAKEILESLANGDPSIYKAPAGELLIKVRSQ